MSKLTTQLQQARQEIAEKEAESRAWEAQLQQARWEIAEKEAELSPEHGRKK